MVFVKYHKEYVGIKKERDSNLQKLELRLKKFGWKNLRWVPSNPLRDSDCGWDLMGCPPNYDGVYEDYYETAIKTLTASKKPWKNLDKVLVRNILNKPFYGFTGNIFG